jgi:hypothetical protein
MSGRRRPSALPPRGLKNNPKKKVKTLKKLGNSCKESSGQPHKRLHQKISVRVVQLECKAVKKWARLHQLNHQN